MLIDMLKLYIVSEARKMRWW